MSHTNFKIILFLILISLTSQALFSQPNEKGNAGIEATPSSVGKRIVNHIVKHRFGWRYPKVCTFYGSLIFADAINDRTITAQIAKGFVPFYNYKRKLHSGHVDYNVFGIWAFELYHQTGDIKYLEIGKKLADDEYKNPRQDGLTSLSRFWVDDLYMVGSLQVQAYKATRDPIYLDRAALQLKTYCDTLQRPNGLFFHRNDAPFYWGRGNGWAAAAMTELLLVLPKTHQHYATILASYKKMMETLRLVQGKDGMWHQLLDDPESYPESSCTGMFIFALASGIDNGWVSINEFNENAFKGWNALAANVNPDGDVMNVCVGTNAKNNKKHYLTRPRSTGNYHGEAAVLWAATAMARLKY